MDSSQCEKQSLFHSTSLFEFISGCFGALGKDIIYASPIAMELPFETSPVNGAIQGFKPTLNCGKHRISSDYSRYENQRHSTILWADPVLPKGPQVLVPTD